MPENSQMPWVVVLDLDIAEVFPTAVASPARMRADLGLSDGAACPQVALKQTGPGTTAVKHAALHAFWTLPKGLLKKLCMDMQPRVTSEGELPDIVPQRTQPKSPPPPPSQTCWSACASARANALYSTGRNLHRLPASDWKA